MNEAQIRAIETASENWFQLLLKMNAEAMDKMASAQSIPEFYAWKATAEHIQRDIMKELTQLPTD